ncbi:hypothetical protein BGZ83_006622 [Gryganskiella cystojenkinii]|nr:hypothetical protein BGZ83_006622 [Gryganskiella cystojenkinii]
MALRKRPGVDMAVGRRPKIVYPTTLQPDPQDRVPTMSIADSAILQATLKQSRYNLTHSAFTRFIPESTTRGPAGKKVASEVNLASVCTVCIGPHIFLDTKFYAVTNPAPPSDPVTVTATATASTSALLPSSSSTFAPGAAGPESRASTPNAGVRSPPAEDSPAIPSTPAILEGPSPQRVIETIMARTAVMSADSEAEAQAAAVDADAKALAAWENNQLAPTATTSSGMAGPTDGPTCSTTSNQSPARRTRSLVESLEKYRLYSKDWSVASLVPTVSSSAVGSSNARPNCTPQEQRPRYQVVFEFSEAPGHRWLFPRDASIELTPATGTDDELRISASFYLQTMEETRVGLSGPGFIPVTGLIPGPAQATTMVLLQATMDLWKSLEQSVNDNASTYRFMVDKLRHPPARTYIPYRLPVDFPNERLESMGLRLLPDHKMESQSGKSKRSRHQDDQTQSSRRGFSAGLGSKRSGADNGSLLSSITADSLSAKRCEYCGSISTPMWRRGPNGNHTLCNPCGLKWRRGQILQHSVGTNQQRDIKMAPATNSDADMTLINSQAQPIEPQRLITTAEAAASMCKDVSLKDELESALKSLELDYMMEVEPAPRRNMGKRPWSSDGTGSGEGGELSRASVSDKLSSTPRKRATKASLSTSAASDPSGPKMVPIHQLGKSPPQSKLSRVAQSSKKEKATVSPSPSLHSEPLTSTATNAAKETKSSPTLPTVSTPAALILAGPSTTLTAALVSQKTSASSSATATPVATPVATPTPIVTPAITPVVTPAATPVVTPIVTPSITPSASATSSPTSATPTVSVGSILNSNAPTSQTPPATQTSPGNVQKPTIATTAKLVGATKAPTSAAAPKASTSTAVPKASTASRASALTAKTSTTKLTATRGPRAKAAPQAQTQTMATVTTATVTAAASSRPSPPAASASSSTNAAKISLLKSYGHVGPRYQVGHPAAVATPPGLLADDHQHGLSPLYATKNLYTNNTATFPLHFPTISIAFGPNNAYYNYPNCAVILFENHFQIKLIQSSNGERAEIDIRKESIEATEFQVIDVGDGESMILLKATLRQYLSRFEKDLLNPDRNENSLVFRFRERLDGGGPPVKPLLEQWLTTEIPVAGGSSSSLSSTTNNTATNSPTMPNTATTTTVGTTNARSSPRPRPAGKSVTVSASASTSASTNSSASASASTSANTSASTTPILSKQS